MPILSIGQPVYKQMYIMCRILQLACTSSPQILHHTHTHTHTHTHISILHVPTQKNVPHAKVGFSKAMSAGWLKINKQAEGGPRVFRKVGQYHVVLSGSDARMLRLVPRPLLSLLFMLCSQDYTKNIALFPGLLHLKLLVACSTLRFCIL